MLLSGVVVGSREDAEREDSGGKEGRRSRSRSSRNGGDGDRRSRRPVARAERGGDGDDCQHKGGLGGGRMRSDRGGEKRARDDSDGRGGSRGAGREVVSRGAGDGRDGAARGNGVEAVSGDGSAAPLAREDWMLAPPKSEQAGGGAPQAPAPSARGPEGEPAQPDQPRAHRLELNPELHAHENSMAIAAVTPGSSTSAPPPPAATVGDGGASWRLKALRRAQERAAAEGRPLSAEVAERWGSVGELARGVGARPAHELAHLHAARDRARGGERPSGERPRGERDGERGGERPGGERGERGAGGGRDRPPSRPPSAAALRRPSSSGSLSWRRPSSAADSDGAGRERDAAAQGGGSGRSEGSRGRGGDAPSRSGAAYASARSRERASPGFRVSGSEVLLAAAPAINTFSNDGSFAEVAARLASKAGEKARLADSSTRCDDSALAPIPEPGAQGLGSSRPDSPERRPARPDSPEHRRPARSDSPEHRRPARSVSPERRPARAASPPRPHPPVDNLSAAAALRAKLLGSRAGGGGFSGSGRGVASTSPNPPEVTRCGVGSPSRSHAVPAHSSSPSARSSEAPPASVPLVDARGRATPGAFGRASLQADARRAGQEAREGGRRDARAGRETQRYDAEGRRDRWLREDDAPRDLADLVRDARHGEEPDTDALVARGIAKNRRLSHRDLVDHDAEYDADVGVSALDGRTSVGRDARRRGRSLADERARAERERLVSDARRLDAALDACPRCAASPRRPRHLTLAAGSRAYLAVPAATPFPWGHCLIIPAEHVPSSREADEATWDEMRNFKKCLSAMAATRGMRYVFLESALFLTSPGSHAVVEAVPLPSAAFAAAPAAFRQELEAASDDFSDNHARRCRETGGKGLRGSIPPGFPYFFAELGLSGGLLHVVDDDRRFDRAVGLKVLGGLVRLPEHLLHGRGQPESRASQAARVARLREDYAPHDWTSALDA